MQVVHVLKIYQAINVQMLSRVGGLCGLLKRSLHFDLLIPISARLSFWTWKWEKSLDAFDPVDGNYPRKNLITSFKVGISNSIMLKMMKWSTVERIHFHNSMLRCIRFWGTNCAKNRINQSMNIYAALETWALHMVNAVIHYFSPIIVFGNSLWQRWDFSFGLS